MDIQTALITAGECLIRGIFGYKPDWIKYLDSGTGLGSDWMTHWKYWTRLGLQKSSIRSTLVRVDHGAGLLEWTPGGDYDFCQCRSRTWSRIFEWKPDPEQEWEFQFLQESDNWFYFFEGLIVRLIYSLFLLDKLIQWWIQGGGQFGATYPPKRLWRLLERRPFAINAPLFGAHGTRNRDKNILNKQFFRVVKRQDLRAGLCPTSSWIAWTVLLFRNSTTVSLILCRVRTAHPSQTQSLSLMTVLVLDLPLGCTQMVCFFARWPLGKEKEK